MTRTIHRSGKGTERPRDRATEANDRRLRGMVIAGLCLAVACAADAAPTLTLDVEALLTDAQTVRQTATDRLWSISTEQGRRMIQLPFTVQPGAAEPVAVGQNTIKLFGGRFLGWIIELHPSDGDAAPSGDAAQLTKQDLDALKIQEEDPARVTPGGFIGPENDRVSVLPPLLTRDLTIQPDGSVTWKLARALPNARVTGKRSLYGMLLDRDNIKRPVMPTIPPRKANENPDQYNQKRAETLEKYKQELDAYNRILKAVNALPTDFTAKRVKRLWAVFDVAEAVREMKIDGEAPLPWGMAFADYDELRKVSKGSVKDQSLNDAASKLIAGDQPHELSIQAASVLMSNRDAMVKALPGSSAEKAAQLVLDEGDRPSRIRLVTTLAENVSKARIAPDLLIKALDDKDMTVVLLAMRGQIESANKDSLNTQQMTAIADTAARLLQEPDAPPIEVILAVPLAAAKKQPSAFELLAGKVRVDQALPQRMDDVIAFVLTAAGEQDDELANRWLSEQLLGGGGALAQRTLTALIAFGAAHESAERARWERFSIDRADHGLVKLLDESNPQQTNKQLADLGWSALGYFKIARPRNATFADQATARPPHMAIARAAVSRDPSPRVAVTFLEQTRGDDRAKPAIELILMQGHGPGLVAAMKYVAGPSGNKLAEAINAMTPERRHETGKAWYTHRIDGATPPAPAPAGQPTDPPVSGAKGLVRKLFGGPKGEEQPAAPSDTQPSTDASPEVAAAPSAPLITGLLRDPRRSDREASPVVVWFARQVAEGKYPTDYEWAKATGDEPLLLRGARLEDADYAVAAACALVSMFRGTEDDGRELYRQLSALPDRGADRAAALKDSQALWQSFSKTLIERIDQSVVGKYKLIIETTLAAAPAPNADPLGPKKDPPPPMPVTLEFGEIELKVTGDKVVPGGMAVDLAYDRGEDVIRLPTPDQLSEIGPAKGNKELAWPKSPVIILKRDPAGGWVAECKIKSGKPATIRLTPIK